MSSTKAEALSAIQLIANQLNALKSTGPRTQDNAGNVRLQQVQRQIAILQHSVATHTLRHFRHTYSEPPAQLARFAGVK